MSIGQFTKTLNGCFFIVFPSFACFEGEWVQVVAHATILKAELYLVSCTKAICLE